MFILTIFRQSSDYIWEWVKNIFLVRCYEAIINRVCAWNKLKQPQFIIKRQSSGADSDYLYKWNGCSYMLKKKSWEIPWTSSLELNQTNLWIIGFQAILIAIYIDQPSWFCKIRKKLIFRALKRKRMRRTIRNEESENF